MAAAEAPQYKFMDGIAGLLPLLVIDDDALQRSLIRRAAERCHYVVTEAGSYREGLARLKAESFACVTLDLNLGDGDGVDILAAMAELNYAGSVIVISGMAAGRRTAAREGARLRGIVPSHSLRKPIDLAALRIALAQLRCQIIKLPMIHNWGEVRDPAAEGTPE